MWAAPQDTHISLLPSRTVCLSRIICVWFQPYLLVTECNTSRKNKVSVKKKKKRTTVSVNAELKAWKRLKRMAKKNLLWNWAWLRQWKNWGNHKILARFCAWLLYKGLQGLALLQSPWCWKLWGMHFGCGLRKKDDKKLQSADPSQRKALVPHQKGGEWMCIYML